MLPSLARRSTLVGLSALLLSACATPTQISLFAGPLSGGFSTSALTLPAALRDDTVPTAPTLRSIPCDAPAPACPAIDSADPIVLECVAGVCDPSPKTLVVPLGDVIDVDAAAGGLDGLLSTIDRIEVRKVDVTVRANTLTVDSAPIQIFWSPEGATGVDESRLLATVPAIAAGSTTVGEVALDAAGVDGLSNHLVNTSRRVRFFARTRVDLVPGGRYPEGALELEAVVSITATGTISG